MLKGVPVTLRTARMAPAAAKSDLAPGVPAAPRPDTSDQLLPNIGDRAVVIALAVVGVAAAVVGDSIFRIQCQQTIACGDRFVASKVDQTAMVAPSPGPSTRASP
jgi:hypothetical protein